MVNSTKYGNVRLSAKKLFVTDIPGAGRKKITETLDMLIVLLIRHQTLAKRR
jgi:hypothetical protein